MFYLEPIGAFMHFLFADWESSLFDHEDVQQVPWVGLNIEIGNAAPAILAYAGQDSSDRNNGNEGDDNERSLDGNWDLL